MKKNIKKIITVMVTVCMTFSAFTFTPVTAFAETDQNNLHSSEKIVVGEYNGCPVVKETAKVFNYIGENEEQIVPFYFSEGYFKDDSSEYNKHLSSMSMVMAMTAMLPKGAYSRAFFEKLGCENVDINKDFAEYEPTKDTIGIAMAMRTLFEGTTAECTLIPVVIRGHYYGNEWISNFIIGEDGDSHGFNTASGKVKDYVLEYMKAHDIDKDKVKILISGYSRGGAVANISGKMISDELGKDNVFAYSFEPPMGADMATDPARPSQYSNLHCVVNYNDMICCVAPSYLNFGHYGTVCVIGKDKDNPGFSNEEAAMKVQLGKFNSVACEKYKSPTDFTWAKLPIKLNDLIDYFTQEEGSLFQDIDTGHKKGNSQRECIDLALERVKVAVPSRKAYASTIPDDVSAASKKIGAGKTYTVEEAIGAAILLVSNISDEQAEQLEADIRNFDFKDAGNLLILGRLYTYLTTVKTVSYSNMISDVWKMLNTDDGEYKALDKILTDSQIAEVKNALPIFVYTAARYVNADYNKDKQTIGAIAYNFNNTVAEAHYPEINFAWLRSKDSYYYTEKMRPIFTIPQGITAESGQKLSDIALPEGFTWDNPSETVGEAGTKSFKASYTPADGETYYTVIGIDITVEVKNAGTSGGGGSGGGGGGADPEQDQKPTNVTNVETAIGSINTSDIYFDSEEKIVAARKAYDALSADEKKQVSNYSKLEYAENALKGYKDKYVPEQVKATGRPAGYDSVELSWPTVDKAGSYDIYRKSSAQMQTAVDTGKQLIKDGYELIGTVKSEESANPGYVDKGLKTGTEYSYVIVAVNHDNKNRKIEVASAEIKATPGIGRVKSLKLTKGNKSATVKWSAVTGATGYKVFRSVKNDSGFKCVKTIKGETTKFVNKKLKSKKTYYFKVRAFATKDGKTVYGAYSVVKSIKIK